jgi:hypothetical protein
LCLAGSDRVLPGSFLGLASLTEFLVSALRLASRLAKLLLLLPEFALELVQFAFQPANLVLDSLDPIDRSILRISRSRH